MPSAIHGVKMAAMSAPGCDKEMGCSKAMPRLRQESPKGAQTMTARSTRY